MSSSAMQDFMSHILTEEGYRKFAYNDATGIRVTCRPIGNLSIGVGINLENGLDDAEIAWLTQHRAELIEDVLMKYSWYPGLSVSCQSVLIDIAYNAGLGGLLHYPRMISFLSQTPPDYASAAGECRTQDPKLDAQRYAGLRARMVA